MKIKNIIVCALGALSVVTANAATLTISGTTTDSATFVQNKAGVATNGLAWGLLVADASGTFATTTEISGFTGSLVTGATFGTATRLLFASTSPTTTNVTKNHTDFNVTPNVITVGGVLSMAYTMDGAFANSGRLAKLIWFDGVGVTGTVVSNGSQSFGVSTASFALPTTNTQTLIVSATDGQNGAANKTFGAVPEPSAALLGALGALGLLRRRRN